MAHPGTVTQDPPRSAAENMEADRRLYEGVSLAPGGPFRARVYEWLRPSITLGISQADSVLDLERCRRDGVEWARRITGGKAVLHHREVTYALAGASRGPLFGSTLYETYLKLGEALGDFFKELGLEAKMIQTRMPGGAAEEACFDLTSLYELEVDGRKLVGSAQKRGRTAFLQHGSIPVLQSPVELLKYLRVPPPSHRPMACLADFGAPPPMEVLKDLLARSLEKRFS